MIERHILLSPGSSTKTDTVIMAQVVPDICPRENTTSTYCYYGRMQKGYSDDWVFDLMDERIVRIGRCGTDIYYMTGIAYFKAVDALIQKKK